VSNWRTTRAERGTDRDFALPRRAPREKQVRNVGAGDQQDEGDGARQHEQRGANFARELVA
jgi:hypothetical protein